MYSKLRIHSLFFILFMLSHDSFVFGVQETPLTTDDSISPERSLEVAERLMASEADLHRKVQLILRWLRIKDQILQNKIVALKGAAPSQEFTDSLQTARVEMVDRLMRETETLEATASGGSLDPLFRQLAFRSMDIQRSDKAYYYFNRIASRSAEDELAFGDALLSSHLSNLALQAYDRALSKDELKPVATYKKAWAQIQLSQFVEAQSLLEQVLDFKGESQRRLRETAFRDWQTPFLENFKKSDFDSTDADKVYVLALKVEDPSSVPLNKASLKTYQSALKDLVSRFSQQGEVKKAEAVFKFLEDGKVAESALIESAPLWLKAYRASLDHSAIEVLLQKIPVSATIDTAQREPFKAELENSAAFYETLVREGKDLSKRPVLGLIYSIYFRFFKTAGANDALRVNAAHFQLEEKKYDECLEILAGRENKDESVKEKSETIEAQCRLKKLDLLYSKNPSDEFSMALEQSLLMDRLYARKGLEESPEKIHEHLVRMLMGAIQKEPQSPLWADRLARLMSQYEFKKDSPLFKELTTLSSQVQFQRLVAESKSTAGGDAASDSNKKHADDFFNIYQTANAQSEISEKALRNSIELSKDEDLMKRCDLYSVNFKKEFKPGQTIFDRCISEADLALKLDNESRYWSVALSALNRDQKIKLALIQMALGKVEGRNLLREMKNDKAMDALKTWDDLKEMDPSERPKTPFSKAFLEVKEHHDKVLDLLRAPVQIASDRIIVSRVREIESVDSEWVKFAKKKPRSLELSYVYWFRARLAKRLAEWYSSLPKPKLSDEELKTYEAKSKQVADAWKARADQLQTECSQIAYALTPEFKPKSELVCEENTKADVREAHMKIWEQSRRGQNLHRQNAFTRYLAASDRASTAGLKKYFLIRATSAASDELERSWVELALGRFTHDEAHIRNAAALNGDLSAAIEYLKGVSKGNPFYEKLYEDQLKILKENSQVNENSLPLSQAEPEKITH